MIKHIIREVAPEYCDFSFYFDGDCFSSRAGDFCYNLFILGDRHHKGLNSKEYEDVQDTMQGVIDGFEEVDTRGYYFQSYKNVMEHYGIKYNSRRCHDLRELVKWADINDPEYVAKYLTIVTGKSWDVQGVCGYCQGDYVEVVYCKDHYADADVKKCGEIWLGCGKEFCVIDVEDYAEPEEEGAEPEYKEVSSCYGYIVADSEAWRDTDYKVIVCDWAGIDFDETRLELIGDSHTYTKYSYRVA